RIILRDVDGRRLPWIPLWHATAVGFMANNRLPVRAGEVARAYMPRRQLPVRFTTALASIGVERVLDGLVLVGLMVLPLAAPSFPPRATIGGAPVSRLAMSAAALFAAVLLVALLVVQRPAQCLALWNRATRALYGIGADQAVSYAVAYHIAGFIPITLLGAYSLSRTHVRLGELRGADAAAA